MPIVVDEVVISVEVANADGGGARPPASAPPVESKQAIVAECVERVLEILREREER